MKIIYSPLPYLEIKNSTIDPRFILIFNSQGDIIYIFACLILEK